MKRSGTEDGMYVLRQMVEERLEVQGSMALGFVDLEKAFDTVPREIVMATLRWMGVPEAEVRTVEGMYEKTTAIVVVREGARMGDDRLPKKAAELREQGRRRPGRPMLRWEDCVKRDVRKLGEEEDCKKKTRYRGGLKRLSDEAVRK